MEGGSVFGRVAAAKRLSAPRALKVASGGVGGVTLKWNALKGAKHYVVVRDGKTLAKTTRHSFTDHKVAPGKSYRYTVRAYDAHNKSSASSTSVRVRIPTASKLPGPSPTNNPIAPIATVGPPQPEPAPTPNPPEPPTPPPTASSTPSPSPSPSPTPSPTASPTSTPTPTP